MDPEGFWFACLFAMFFPCTILQGLFGDSDRLASDIDTWHARRPLYNTFSFSSWMVYYCNPTTPGGCFIFMQVFFMWIDEEKQEYHLIRTFLEIVAVAVATVAC